MPLAIPPELKKISPFVRRAEELDRDKTSAESRLVSYYCRQYAVHTGIPLASSSPAAKTCLGGLLAALETEKPAMDNFTRDEAAFLCRKFAMTVFEKADQEDRQGGTNYKNTAKTFYAAASFLQILEQFEQTGSENSEEDRKRVIYAKWKATDILKALKEGRVPVPGGYAEDDGEHEDDEDEKQEKKEDAPPAVETVIDEDESKEDPFFDLPVAPPKPLPPPMPPAESVAHPPEDPEEEEDEEEEEEDEEEEEPGQEVELGPPPAYESTTTTSPVEKPKLTFQLPPPVETPPKPKKSGGIFGGFGKKKGGRVTNAQLTDATELTRFAMSALEDKDADLAAERLQQALAALGR
jgi:vacuolar protein sorting-associated protein VTA1